MLNTTRKLALLAALGAGATVRWRQLLSNQIKGIAQGSVTAPSGGRK